MVAPPLAASVWGTPGRLPSLDPGSLYAVALLQLAYGDTHERYTLAPRPWPHPDTVPSLYTAQTFQGKVLVGEALATTPDAIRDYLRAHAPLDAPLRAAPLAAARAQATQAVLDDALADLVLHTLFSLPPNFQQVTAPALAEPRKHTLPSSLPRRLRAAVRTRLESPAIGLWGLGGSWERQEMEEARRWNTTAGLAQARDPAAQLPKTGLAQHPTLASDVQEAWERSRIAARARELFATLRTMLGAGPFLVGCAQPTSVDARLYSLLAPLLLGPELPVYVLSSLLHAEFPELVHHTERLHQHLWGPATKDGWAFQRTPAVHAQPSWSLQPLWAALNPRNWFTQEREPTTQHLPPTLRYGRLAFYVWAVFGSLAYIALTGLITIEYQDPDAEVAEEEEEEEEENNASLAGSAQDDAATELRTEPPVGDEAPEATDRGSLDPAEFLEEERKEE